MFDIFNENARWKTKVNEPKLMMTTATGCPNEAVVGGLEFLVINKYILDISLPEWCSGSS